MVRTERQWKSVKMAPLPKEVSAPTTKALDPSAVKALNVSPAQILFRRQEQLDITTKVSLAIPPRRMWGCDAGGGYCGECSFQTALLYFGNYCSQERVRYVASNQELLIGIHDEKVADKFLLNSDSVSMPGEAMLNWIVPHITAGHLVIAGWVGYIEGGEHADEYDHIMPIVGVEYDTTGKGKLKVSAMEYHDLYYNRVCRATRNDDEPTSHGPLLTSNKEAIARRKKQWDSDDDDDSDDSDDEEDDGETTDNSGVFDPEEDKDFYVFPAHKAYAVAVTGVHDERDELKRCVLQVSSWEEPDWGAENEKDRKPRRLQATLTVLGLTEGNPYAVLRFDDIKDVPKAGNFLASQKWCKCFTFTASGESVSLPNFDTLATNGTYFYRVVDFAPEAV